MARLRGGLLLLCVIATAAADRRWRDVTALDSPLDAVVDEWRQPPVDLANATNRTTVSPPRWQSSILFTFTVLVYFWVGSVVFAVAYAYRMLHPPGPKNRLVLDEDDAGGLHYYRQWVDAL